MRRLVTTILDELRGRDAPGDETGDGVFEVRRTLLLLSAAAAVSLLTPRVSAARQIAPAATANRTTWSEFLTACVPGAVERHANTSASGQDAYLYWIASMASRLDASTIPKGKLAPFGGFEPIIETGPAYFGKPFFVIEWRMAPNANLPPHNHPQISVCTVCTDGEARLRNYDVVGAAPAYTSSQPFQVRNTHDELLTPGRINCLSAVRDNVHTLRAGPRGASGIDITTYHGKDEGFSFLTIDGKPRDPDRQIYDAVWTKRSTDR